MLAVDALNGQDITDEREENRENSRSLGQLIDPYLEDRNE